MADALPDLTYRRTGRRSETLAALVACVLFLIIAVAWNAPPILYGPVALAIAVLGVVLKRNPVHGMRLTPNTWEITTNGAERAILLADLAAVRFHRWTDGPPSVTLRFHGGAEEEISTLGLPRSDLLSEALAARGVRIEVD